MEQSSYSAGDRAVFERVWRRVMPEDRADCPFVLGEEPGQPPAVGEAAALPVPAAPARAVGEGTPASPLPGFIDGALAAWRQYESLARRTRGGGGRTLSGLASAARHRARRLSAAYFLLTGVHYWPASAGGAEGRLPLAAALRERFWAGRRAAAALRTAGEAADDPAVGELCRALAGEEEADARRVWGILEGL